MINLQNLAKYNASITYVKKEHASWLDYFSKAILPKDIDGTPVAEKQTALAMREITMQLSSENDQTVESLDAEFVKANKEYIQPQEIMLSITKGMQQALTRKATIKLIQTNEP